MSSTSRGVSAKVSDAWSVGGVSEVVRRAWGRSKSLLPQGPECSLRQVSMADALVFTDPHEAVLAVIGADPLPTEQFAFIPARSALDSTVPGDSVNWTTDYDLGSRSQLALFLLITFLAPRSVIETGVAAGASTTQILTALEHQGSGTLLSIDVISNVGELIPDELKHRWHLEVLPERDRQKTFRNILARHSGFQIFVHDSDHSEKWQHLEYEAASDFAAPNAIICSDDVEASPAFVDFCISRGLRPILLLDGRKVMGLVKLTG
jgi:hypothetical protein